MACAMTFIVHFVQKKKIFCYLNCKFQRSAETQSGVERERAESGSSGLNSLRSRAIMLLMMDEQLLMDFRSNPTRIFAGITELLAA